MGRFAYIPLHNFPVEVLAIRAVKAGSQVLLDVHHGLGAHLRPHPHYVTTSRQAIAFRCTSGLGLAIIMPNHEVTLVPQAPVDRSGCLTLRRAERGPDGRESAVQRRL